MVLCELSYLGSDLSTNGIPLRLQLFVPLDGLHWTSFKVLQHDLLDSAIMSVKVIAYLERPTGMNPVLLGKSDP